MNTCAPKEGADDAETEPDAAAEQAVGWVVLDAEAEAPGEVFQDGNYVGRTEVEVTQRAGAASEYRVELEGYPVCVDSLMVRDYERICVRCNTQTKKLDIVQCAAEGG